MRILVGYDGSVSADGALYDLTEAGLPLEGEALVLTATVPWAPFGPGGDPAAVKAAKAARADEGGHEARIRDYSRQALAESAVTAERGARFLQKEFPAWRIKAESILEDAAHGILLRSETWKADLVVLGTPDRTALGRFLRGSVTQKVLHHSRASVRISRPRVAGRLKSPLLILAMDGSAGAEQALRALTARSWPPGTTVRVVAVMDKRRAKGEMAERAEALGHLPGKPGPSRLRRQALSWIEKKVEGACGILSAAGLRAVPSILAGDPRRALLAEAREWEARALFLGARGLNPVERFVLGSVSAALASHAPCSVEVHHSRRMSARNLIDRPAPNRKSMRQR